MMEGEEWGRGKRMEKDEDGRGFVGMCDLYVYRSWFSSHPPPS